MSLLIGTRGSKLALAQSEWVTAHLRVSGADVSIHILRTAGDEDHGEQAAVGFGVFVTEIERALLHGEISLAVHSLKDLPTGPREGLRIAAIPERADPSDALLTRTGRGLAELPPASRVATGSPRRIANLRAHRPDLTYVPVRGNVDTRLRKLDAGEFDALVLATAGLLRLDLEARITERLPSFICLPAPGQGALALQIRSDDAHTADLLRPLDHLPTRAAVTAERAFLEALGGGCELPVSALGHVEAESLLLRGRISDPLGERVFAGQEEGLAGRRGIPRPRTGGAPDSPTARPALWRPPDDRARNRAISSAPAPAIPASSPAAASRSSARPTSSSTTAL